MDEDKNDMDYPCQYCDRDCDTWESYCDDCDPEDI